MKLTKDEIRAIASTIVKQKREEFKKELNEKVKKFKSDPKNKALAKKYSDAYNSVPSELRGEIRWERNTSAETFIEAMSKHQIEKFEKRKEEPHYSNYIDEITIAAIDVNSIKELEAKLKVKLS